MKNLFILSVIYLLTFSCRERKPSEFSDTKKELKMSDSLISRRINFNSSSSDTSDIEFENSGFLFRMHYSQNQPQYIVVKNKTLADRIKMNHFAQENNGLYLSLSDSVSVKAFGVKYLNGHNGIDIIMNQANNGIKFLNHWKEYTNDGERYDFSNIEQGIVKVYTYKEGDVVDSFFMKKVDK